ncbi:MAG: hypothetical protein ACYCSQ_04690 [bacterium]
MAILFKDKNRPLILKAVFVLFMLSALLLYPLSVKKAFAGGCGCRGVYSSNPIIYALYLKAKNRPISKNDIIAYIKIVNPAQYKHDRYNPFLWNKLFLKDKTRLTKLMDYINSVKCFKENINADISGYIFKKHGFYLMYSEKNRVIRDGMKTHRNIDFIKTKHGNIYYLFRRLTIAHQNAGDFNFLSVPEKKAENFINKRTGTFGHIKKSVYLEYYFIPLTAKHNILTVKVLCVKVYNNKHKNFLLGIVK